MKAFLTLFLAVCLVAFAVASPLELSDEQKAKIHDHIEQCIKDENLTEEEAEKARKKDHSDPSANIKCFATCVFEKIGTLKDNNVQEDVVITKLGGVIGEDKAKTVLERCKDAKGEERCEKGFEIYECFEKTKKELSA